MFKNALVLAFLAVLGGSLVGCTGGSDKDTAETAE